MAKKNETEVMAVSPELQKNIDIILSLKSQVDEIGLNCLQIKVIDDSSLSVAQQNLRKANDISKSIEDKRKTIKEPYLQAGKLIDKTCADLADAIEKGIAHIKLEVKGWETKRQEEAKKAQVEIEAKLKAQQAAAEAEAIRKAEIQKYITEKAIPQLKRFVELSDTVLNCEQNIAKIEGSYRPREFFAEFADEAYSLRDNYLDIIKSKKQQLESADTLTEAQKELAKEKEDLARQSAELEEKRAAIKAKEELAAQLEARRLAEEAAGQERKKLATESELNKTRGIKYLWKTELVDKSKLIEDWITVDEVKVKEYFKANKDFINDGEIINGVKFYKEINVSA